MPCPGCASRIETRAVVLDAHRELLRGACHADTDAARLRVARGVRERLLHDAIHVQLLLGREEPFDRYRRQLERELVAFGKLTQMSAQRIRETEAEQLGGMVLADDARQRLGDARDRRACGGERGLDGFRHRARAQVERVDQDADGGERLADVVVELARDPAALALERLQELGGEVRAHRLVRLALRDVARHAEEVRLALELERAPC